MAMGGNEPDSVAESSSSNSSSSSSSSSSGSSSSSSSSSDSSSEGRSSSQSNKANDPNEESDSKSLNSSDSCEDSQSSEEDEKTVVPAASTTLESAFSAGELFSHNSPCPSEDGFEGFSSPGREKKLTGMEMISQDAAEALTNDNEDSAYTYCDESEDEKLESYSNSELDEVESHIGINKSSDVGDVTNDVSVSHENFLEKISNVIEGEVKHCATSTPKPTTSISQSVEQMTKAAIGEVVEALDDDKTGMAVKLPNNVIKKIIEKKEELHIEGPSKLSSGTPLCAPRKNDIIVAPSKVKRNMIFSDFKPSVGVEAGREQTGLTPREEVPSQIVNGQPSSAKKNIQGDSDALPTVAEQTSIRKPNSVKIKCVNGGAALPALTVSSQSSSDEEEDEEMDHDDEPPLPIQAEVVMSEGSDSENRSLSNKKKGSVVQLPFQNSNETLSKTLQTADIAELLQSYVGGDKGGEMVQFHPPSSTLPESCSNVSLWQQLDSGQLPAYVPSQKTPDWIRVTIPSEGYKCHSCGDTYFLEASRDNHLQRRSMLITLECGPCDAKLTFYNRCTLREHLRTHITKGEDVDEDIVEVRSLPLHLTPLLQPYCVPVPQVQSAAGDNGVLNQTKNSTRTRMLRCFMCDRMFYSVRELMSHMRTDRAYSDKRVECRKCLLVLPSVCAAKAHILSHPPTNEVNVSVCPECGTPCESPRDFVHHIATCGHHFRRSGIICNACHVCFFRSEEDFLSHWVKEHCSKSYECSVCCQRFESPVFHSCSAPGQQVLSSFRCVLDCPQCEGSVLVDTLEQDDIHFYVREHLDKSHNRTINRVHYVYKSKFCSNAFRSKDELRAHHEREHRRDNHYRAKSCSLHHTVVAAQQKYSIAANEVRNAEQKGALVSLPIILNAEEQEEARAREIPTVSSLFDKDLFPDMPSVVDPLTGQRVTVVDGVKVDALTGEVLTTPASDSPKSKLPADDGSSPYVCYRCGLTHSERKKHKRHVRNCTGEVRDRTCRVCHNSFRGESFVLHCRYHMQQGIVLCMFCNAAQFESIEKLHSHFEKHAHEQFVYPAICPFCSIVMPDVASSLSHLIEKHAFLMNLNSSNAATQISASSSQPVIIAAAPEAFVACEKCGRKFQGGRALSVHALSCNASGAQTQMSSPRQCLACKRVLTHDTIGKHMAGHLQEGFIVCGLCDGKPIGSSVDLLQHLETHIASLSYPYSCVMCQSHLEDASCALEHLKEEHGLGHLACPECDMSYTFSQQLIRHTEIVHRICLYSKRRYICWICRAYDHVKKDTLMNHFQTAHGLERSEVNEKLMIRTRGQGTMPTSQFVPTKQVKKKPIATDKLSEEQQSISIRESSPVGSASSSPETKVTTGGKDTSPVSVKVPTAQITLPSSPPTSVTCSTPAAPAVVIPSKLNDTKNTQKIIRVDIKEALLKPQVTKVRIEEATSSSVNKPSPKVNVTISTGSKIPASNTAVSPPVPGTAPDVGVKRKLDTSSDGEYSSEVSVCSDLSSSYDSKKKKKAHQCDQCNFATNFREKLERHKQRQHESSQVAGFLCQECGQSFVVQQSLVRHMFFAHKIKWQRDTASRSESPDAKKLDKTDEQSKTVGIKRPAGCQLVMESGKMLRLSTEDRTEDRPMALSNLPKVTARGIFSAKRPDGGKVLVTQSSIVRVERSKSVDGAPPIMSKIVAKPAGDKPFVSSPAVKSVSVVSFGSNAANVDHPKSIISTDGRTIHHQGTSKTIVVGKPLQLQSSIITVRPPVKISCSSASPGVLDKTSHAPIRTVLSASNSSTGSVPQLVSVRVPHVASVSPSSNSSSGSVNVSKTNVDSLTISLNHSNLTVASRLQTGVLRTPSISRVSSAPQSQCNSIISIATPTPAVSPTSSVQSLPSVTLITSNSANQLTLSPSESGGGGKYLCGVCKEEFSSSSEQYSHMRTHGMAFLQIGRKTRVLPSTTTSSTIIKEMVCVKNDDTEFNSP